MQTLKLTKKYQKYPEYKDSGSEWLGPIPASWAFEKLKYSAPLVTEKVSKENLQGKYVALENVEPRTGRYIPSVEDVEPESIVNVFENTDVLFGKLRPYLSKVFAPNFSGTSASEFFVLRPGKKVATKYLFYRLLSPEFIKAVSDSTYGAQMPRANWTFVGGLRITLPSLPEQKKIGAYLDEKTATIDRIIEKKKKQIELLHEKRTAFIHHFITKGLDADAKLVDSGIDWIGRIPVTFRIKKIKHILTLGYGKELKPEDRKDDGKYPVYGANGAVGRSDKYFYAGRSMVIGRKGSVGELNLVDEPFWPLDVTYFVKHIDADLRWAFYVLLASNILDLGTGIKPGLSRSEIYNMDIPFVELSLQKSIMSFLDKNVSAIDLAAVKAQKSIDLLEEFKSALISHVVTGKIKV